jgi:hypothetical protein
LYCAASLKEAFKILFRRSVKYDADRPDDWGFRLLLTMELEGWRTQCSTEEVTNAAIFWDIVPCSPYVYDVSEESIISIFRVENQPSKKPAWLAHQFTHRLHDAISKKMVTFKLKETYKTSGFMKSTGLPSRERRLLILTKALY